METRGNLVKFKQPVDTSSEDWQKKSSLYHNLKFDSFYKNQNKDLEDDVDLDTELSQYLLIDCDDETFNNYHKDNNEMIESVTKNLTFSNKIDFNNNLKKNKKTSPNRVLNKKTKPKNLEIINFDETLIKEISDRMTLSGENKIKIGILDTGVNDHSKLKGVINKDKSISFNPKENTDPSDVGNHGTPIAGIIGAKHDSSEMIGISPNIEIIDIKVAKNVDSFDLFAICNAIVYAIENDVKIINLSSGLPYLPNANSIDTEYYKFVSIFSKLIEKAYSKDIFIVFSAGNHNKDAVDYLPINHEKLIVVGAIDNNGKRWQNREGSGSNFGEPVTIYAPGVEILTTSGNNNNEIELMGPGVSFAIPHVVGLLALMLQANPGLKFDEAKDKIYDNGVDLDLNGDTKNHGNKKPKYINISKTIQSLLNQKIFNIMASKVLKNRPYRTIWTLINQYVTDPAKLTKIQAILNKLGYNPGHCNNSERIWNGSAWVCPPNTLRTVKSKLLIPTVGSSVTLLNKNNNEILQSGTQLDNWNVISPNSSPNTVKNVKIHLEADFNGTLETVDFTVPWV